MRTQEQINLHGKTQRGKRQHQRLEVIRHPQKFMVLKEMFHFSVQISSDKSLV